MEYNQPLDYSQMTASCTESSDHQKTARYSNKTSTSSSTGVTDGIWTSMVKGATLSDSQMPGSTTFIPDTQWRDMC